MSQHRSWYHSWHLTNMTVLNYCLWNHDTRVYQSPGIRVTRMHHQEGGLFEHVARYIWCSAGRNILVKSKRWVGGMVEYLRTRIVLCRQLSLQAFYISYDEYGWKNMTEYVFMPWVGGKHSLDSRYTAVAKPLTSPWFLFYAEAPRWQQSSIRFGKVPYF